MAKDNQIIQQFKTDLSPSERERCSRLLRDMARHAGNCALALETGQDLAASKAYMMLSLSFIWIQLLDERLLKAFLEQNPKDEFPDVIFPR